MQEFEEKLLRRRREFSILRVDRADLSKNVLRGFTGFDIFLEQHPEFAERITFTAQLMPSRTDVPEYAEYLERIEALVAVVNHRHGTPDWMPIDLKLRDDLDEAVASYKHYDVMMVNAMFDGMNLVAKEGPLVNERDGVSILSENTGAHEELGEYALSVNPFDVQELADSIYAALTMEGDERARRAKGLKDIVTSRDPGELDRRSGRGHPQEGAGRGAAGVGRGGRRRAGRGRAARAGGPGRAARAGRFRFLRDRSRKRGTHRSKPNSSSAGSTVGAGGGAAGGWPTAGGGGVGASAGGGATAGAGAVRLDRRRRPGRRAAGPASAPPPPFGPRRGRSRLATLPPFVPRRRPVPPPHPAAVRPSPRPRPLPRARSTLAGLGARRPPAAGRSGAATSGTAGITTPLGTAGGWPDEPRPQHHEREHRDPARQAAHVAPAHPSPHAP